MSSSVSAISSTDPRKLLELADTMPLSPMAANLLTLGEDILVMWAVDHAAMPALMEMRVIPQHARNPACSIKYRMQISAALIGSLPQTAPPQGDVIARGPTQSTIHQGVRAYAGPHHRRASAVRA